MKKLVLAFIAVVFAASVASAQTTVEAGKAYNLSAPHDCKNVTAYKVMVDKAQVGADLPPSACVTGLVTTPTLPALLAGVHTFAIDTFNGSLVAPGAVLTATALVMPNPVGVPTFKVITTTAFNLQIQPDGTAIVTNTTTAVTTEKIQ